MAEWAELDLNLNGARLRAYRTGRRGAPPVVLVHGLTDNARYWARTAEALAPDYDLVLYDARGHGRSDPAPAPFTEGTRVADLAAVVAALGLQRPALIGHSMGAATVAAAVSQQPGLARGIVLEDPPWLGGPPAGPERTRAYLDEWKTWLVDLRSRPRAEALELRRASAPDWSPQDAQLSLEARLECDLGVLDHYQPSGAPWQEVVAKIDCPILLVTGEPARGAYVTPEVAQAAAGLWRAGRWVHVEGASHSVRYSRFEAYREAVRQFLAEL